MDNEGKGGGFKGIFIVMVISLLIAFFWDSVEFVKNAVHAILNPTAGVLLGWNLTLGMLILVLIITFFMTIMQKYTTDQKTLKDMKAQQKILQKEMKEYKDHPEKLMELQKKQFEFIPKTMKLSMRAIMFTGIPFILFFRWFMDVFTTLGEPKFFGFLSWFWFYLIFVMIFSSILRKILKVV